MAADIVAGRGRGGRTAIKKLNPSHAPQPLLRFILAACGKIRNQSPKQAMAVEASIPCTAVQCRYVCMYVCIVYMYEGVGFYGTVGSGGGGGSDAVSTLSWLGLIPVSNKKKEQR